MIDISSVRKYAIIDIETTGGLYNRDKIIEIAIIVTDGKKIIDQYESLINPERSIPYSITRITGIDDDMVIDAPKFYEVARKIVEITDGCVFIAHNVNFDYGFIKHEFRNLGYAFNKKRLCTVKLTRILMPGLSSYGLDNLIRHFNLQVENRHRAYGDTYATFEIFSYLYQNRLDEQHIDLIINDGIDASVLPHGMDIDMIHDSPETPGVYYLSNVHKRIIYVGKAKNIKDRLFQHFRNLSRKSVNIHNQVHHIHHNETGNELIALLLELHEIKTIQPELNKSLRRNNYPYGLYYDPNASHEKASILILKHNNASDKKYEKIKLFGSKISADTFLQTLILEHDICGKLAQSRGKILICGCGGSCHSFFQNHQEKVENILIQIKNEFPTDFILLLDGRGPHEKSFIMIHEGRFWGFGFVPKDETISTREKWNDYISYQFSYPEANGIIKHYMSKNKVTKIPL